MVWDLICFRKSSEFQALDSFAKKLRAPEPTGFPRLKAVSPEVEAGIIWRRNLQIKSVPLRHILWDSVRLDTLTDFCQDDPRWSKMIQDDQDDQDVQCPSVSQCNGSFRCSLCSRLNSARPQRLQLAVRYESWLDDKRLDVTPDLRLEIRNSNEFRIIRIIGISKKS